MDQYINLIMATLFILICVIGALLSRFKKYKRVYVLLKYIRWCTGVGGWESGRDFSLMEYINDAAIELGIPTEYRISEQEHDTAKEIINLCVQHLTNLFIADHLLLHKGTRKHPITELDFFMVDLNAYLQKNSVESFVSGHSMHSKTTSYKGYGSWGGPLYDAEYELTEFGIVFSKLELISYEYCKHSDSINPNKTSYKDSSYLKERIDKKTIGISRI